MRSRAGTAPHRLGITTIQQRSGAVSWLCKCRGCSGPLQSSAPGPRDSKRANSFGPEPRASKRHDLLHCEQAFDPRSRNAVGEGRSRPRGMRLIRTLTGCPASKRSGIPKHRSAHQRFNSLSALTPETAHPFTHPRSLIRHPHLHENWM